MTVSRQQREFGDFQTPSGLAGDVCRLLRRRGLAPQTIIEPTCGMGNFLLAATTQFPQAEVALGCEINAQHLAALHMRLPVLGSGTRMALRQANFFETDWPEMLRGLPEPWLIVGNPPWVTNSELGSLTSHNLPNKSNAAHLAGLEALTGKSNFDVSEWMLLRICEWLDGRRGTMAMLCKTAVARKVLQSAWRQRQQLDSAAIYALDAKAHFKAHVPACLLVCEFRPGGSVQSAELYDHLDAPWSQQRITWRQSQLITNVEAFDRWRHLAAGGDAQPYVWRSGIKHDCAAIMELRADGDAWCNQAGERIALEEACLYPLLKSSDLANGNTDAPRRWMLVPQLTAQADTEPLRELAPRTWSYLLAHAALLDGRRSSIYRKRPRFAVFGVGEYSFSPYKVAISAFYKRFQFHVLGKHQSKPMVVDDTVNFLSCSSREEAQRLASLLNSRIARDFYSAFVQWDAKRPITIDLLKRLDLRKLAVACDDTAAVAAAVP